MGQVVLEWHASAIAQVSSMLVGVASAASASLRPTIRECRIRDALSLSSKFLVNKRRQSLSGSNRTASLEVRRLPIEMRLSRIET